MRPGSVGSVNRRYYRCYPSDCTPWDVNAIEVFYLRYVEGLESITLNVHGASGAVSTKTASVAALALAVGTALLLALSPWT